MPNQCIDCNRHIRKPSIRCKKCFIEYNKPKNNITCDFCKKPFHKRISHILRHSFCSRSCWNNFLLILEGSISSRGYLVYTIKGKRIFAHRYIMEQYLGRSLKSEEVVHHKDRNTLNNEIKNLEVMTKANHLSLHHKDKIMLPEQRLKISMAGKGRKVSQETRQKISSGIIKHYSKAENRKHLKQPRSAETRNKMSVAQKLRRLKEHQETVSESISKI